MRKLHLVVALVVVLCGAALVAQSQSLPGRSDSNPAPPPTSGSFGYNTFKPAVCAPYVDPVFGATVKRLSGDRQFDDIYARNMWFNADATRFAHGGSIIDVATCKVTHTVSRGSFTGDAGFDAVDPNVYYYLSGSTIKKVVLGANGAKTESTFYTGSGALGSYGQSVNWMSKDGSLFIVVVGGQTKVIDRLSMTAYSGSAAAASGGGWIGIAPSGNYVVGYWGNSGRSWKIDKAAKSVAAQNIFWDGQCGDHADFLSASDGKDYAIVQECNQQDGIWRVPIDAKASGLGWEAQTKMPGVMEVLKPHKRWTFGKHFSTAARGPLQDWAFISMECDGGCSDNFNSTPSNWPAFQQEIIAVNLLTGEWRRVAHHRSRSIPQDYGYQPRLTSSWGGEYICWASNYNTSGGGDIYCAAFGSGSNTPVPPDPPAPDTVPPTVQFTKPVNGAQFTAGTPVEIVATATDAVDGALTPVLTLGGQPITSPRTFAIAGTYTVVASATDQSGNLGTANVSIVIVAVPDPPDPPQPPTTDSLPNGSYGIADTWADARPLKAGQYIEKAGNTTVYTLTLTAGPRTFQWRVSGTSAQVIVDGVVRNTTTAASGTTFGIHWTGTAIVFKRNTVTTRTIAGVTGPVTASATLASGVSVKGGD